MCICYVLWEYVNMKGKQKYLYKMRRRARSAPHPLPPLRWRSRGGRGGGRLASYVLPGDLEQGRGDLWLVNLAGHIRVWIWRVPMASHFGGFAGRVHLAGQVGAFIQWVLKARKTCCWAKRNRKEWNVLWWICRLQYHYVVSNIVLFAFIAGSPEPANCGLKTVVMWICESDCEWK